MYWNCAICQYHRLNTVQNNRTYNVSKLTSRCNYALLSFCLSGKSNKMPRLALRYLRSTSNWYHRSFRDFQNFLKTKKINSFLFLLVSGKLLKRKIWRKIMLKQFLENINFIVKNFYWHYHWLLRRIILIGMKNWFSSVLIFNLYLSGNHPRFNE